ncbi:MAG: hypothetical protein H0V02_05075 [Nocardioidaceae bacterium]|nr:hypothetical protein [Nocardioidaceae bacterium]
MSYGDNPPPNQGGGGSYPPSGQGGYPGEGSGGYPPPGQGGYPPGQGFPPPGQSYPPPNSGGYSGGQEPPGSNPGATNQGEPPRGGSKLPLLIGLLVALLLIGGVVAYTLLSGDDDADNEANEATQTEATVEPTTEEPTTEEPTTEEPTTEEPADGDDAAYCAELTELQSRFTEFNTGNVTNEQLASMVSGLADLQEVAPDDVSGDVDTLVTGFGSLQSVLDDLGLTFEELQDPAVLQEQAPEWTPEQLKSLRNLDKELNNAKFQGAGDALDADYAARC